MALIDSGSMVTTVSKTFYDKCLRQQHPMEKVEIVMDIEGAAGQYVPYLGVTEVNFALPGVVMEELWTPALVVPDTNFSKRVPVIIGTNVISVLKSRGVLHEHMGTCLSRNRESGCRT